MEKAKTSMDHYHMFILLMLSGGFMGAYSYYLKGGVFANAETANLLILALNAANGDWQRMVSVLVPITTFFIGTFLSELLSDRLKRRWPSLLLVGEMLLLALLSFLPQSTPFTIYHVAIALISSMQYNTFRQARGVQLSTLFCTAHLRGGGSMLYHALKDGDRGALRKSMYHIGMILTFVLGALSCALASRILGTHTLVLGAIPLAIVLFEILKREKSGN